jgi:hypothetical protein
MASIEKFPRTKALDLAKLEADVTAAFPPLPVRAAPSIHSEPLPDYVEHREGVSRVGALTAEAVVRDYEAAAKEIEAMGAELVSAAKQCEAMTADVHNTIAFMRDPQRHIVRKPKRFSSVSRSVRCSPRTFARPAKLSNVG